MDGFFANLPPDVQAGVQEFLRSFPKQGNDLEFLLTKLARYQQLEDETQLDHSLLECINQTRLREKLKIASSIKEEVFRTIIRIYGELSAEATRKAIEIYRNLFFGLLERTSNRPKVLAIFTTNYDLTFETLRDEIPEFRVCNGISLRGGYGVWDPITYEEGQYEFAVFRLHGCSHWVRRKSDERIVFSPTPDRDNLASREPCILYPEPGKDERVDTPPFATAYRHFKLCLEAAKCVVIIGYSGRDLVVQQHIRDSLMADRNKRFVVVTNTTVPSALAQAIPESNRRVLLGGIESNASNVVNAVHRLLSVMDRRPHDLQEVYDSHKAESARELDPERQCQCDECVEWRTRLGRA